MCAMHKCIVCRWCILKNVWVCALIMHVDSEIAASNWPRRRVKALVSIEDTLLYAILSM